MNRYPKTFEGTLNGTVIATGLETFLWKPENCTNDKKRQSGEHGRRKTADDEEDINVKNPKLQRDSYGCVAWQPELSADKPAETRKKEKLCDANRVQGGFTKGVAGGAAHVLDVSITTRIHPHVQECPRREAKLSIHFCFKRTISVPMQIHWLAPTSPKPLTSDWRLLASRFFGMLIVKWKKKKIKREGMLARNWSRQNE